MVLPLTFQQHIDLMCKLYWQGNKRLAEQIAYHLSVSVGDDLYIPLKFNNLTCSLASAKYILILNMQTLGMIK